MQTPLEAVKTTLPGRPSLVFTLLSQDLDLIPSAYDVWTGAWCISSSSSPAFGLPVRVS